MLIRPNQTESTRGKNVIIGEERFEPSKSHQEAPAKKIPEDLLKDSTLGGQEQKKSARSAQDRSDRSLWEFWKKIPETIRKKERPSFKELLAKYEKKGVVQKQRGGQIKSRIQSHHRLKSDRV